jgi:hypothetical protein
MPRARWVKPEFFTDKKVASLDPTTAIVYEALWVWADDGGVCICDPDWVKNQIFFRWDAFTIPVISKGLRDLCDKRMITVYRMGDDYFAQIRHWDRHQKVHKPAKFRHPRPDEQLTFNRDGFPPGSAGEAPGPFHSSPPPRLLDTKTPRHLDAVVAEALPPGNHQHSPETATAATAANWSSPIEEEGRPPHLEIPKTGKVAGELSLARRLEDDTDRLALTTICATVPAPHQWVAEAAVSLDGMHGKPLTPRQLGDALKQFVGKGRHLASPPSFREFQAFLKSASTPPETKGSPEPGSVDSRATTGEAGAILVRIKELRGKATPPGQAAVEFIRRTDVEALGRDVFAAYDAIGGAEAVLKTSGDKWSFLVRDFAAALTHARKNGGANG